MDQLLNSRNTEVTALEATKSAEALIAYLNQSEYGHWIIEHYAHISIADRLIFIKGMNMTLPYVADRENFISNIKFSLKDNLCKYFDLDCWIYDFLAPCRAECILTDEGYKVINKKMRRI